MSGFFLDTAGLVPAVEPGANVAFARDFAGLGRHGQQATAASRPILVRWPRSGRRNLFLQTEAMANALWLVTRASVVDGAGLAPDGSLTASRLSEDTSENNTHNLWAPQTDFVAGTRYTFSTLVRPAGRANVRLLLPAAAFGTNHLVQVNLLTGAVTNSTTAGGAIFAGAAGGASGSALLRRSRSLHASRSGSAGRRMR